MVEIFFFVPKPIAFETMNQITAVEGIKLMKQGRFTSIEHCLAAMDKEEFIPEEGRDVWRQSNTKSRLYENIENMIYMNSVNILLNKKSGSLVVDDELIASKAKDVECKTLSSCKKGKEGSSVDCLSCSLLSIVYGMRL